MKALKLFWSRGHEHNAGDWFSPLICERLSGRPVVYADPRRCDLVAAGSLLGRLRKSHTLHRLGLSRALHIWGTGSLRPEDRLPGSHYLHALRGRLTLARCESAEAPPEMGDPGLLADLLVDGPVAKRHGIGVIAHLADRDHPEVSAFIARTPHARLLDVTAPVRDLLAGMARCEGVLASGLHGLVFADALGIPNRWFTASGGTARRPAQVRRLFQRLRHAGRPRAPVRPGYRDGFRRLSPARHRGAQAGSDGEFPLSLPGSLTPAAAAASTITGNQK